MLFNVMNFSSFYEVLVSLYTFLNADRRGDRDFGVPGTGFITPESERDQKPYPQLLWDLRLF